MNKNWFPSIVSLVLIHALCVSTARAQVNTEFSIKKIDPSLVEAPQISAGSYRKQQSGAARSIPWLEVDVNFERNDVSKQAPKFTDDLTVNFFILLNNAALTEDKKPTLLSGSTTISDVPYGKGLHVAAFVAPQSLARYFDGKAPINIQQGVIDVGVTISSGSDLRAISSLKNLDVAKQGKGWWEAESGMTKVSGRILEKNQTPFAPLAWDYYLPSQSKSAN